MSTNEERPYSDSHLDSPEYRKRLMRKLNTLIAVLEVACAKVRRSLSMPEADSDRLNRIHKNLNDTLQVCLRAKKALERCEQLPGGLPEELSQVVGEHGRMLPELARGAMSPDQRRNVEMSSAEEEEKFRNLGPIDPIDIRTCDFEELCRRLVGEE
jgi:hypothetical protein